MKTAALIGEYLEPMRKMPFEAAQRLNGEFGIPWPAIVATCPAPTTVRFTDDTQMFFRRDPAGVHAWVIPVTCVDAGRPEEIETRDPLGAVACGHVIDLLAFDPERPRRFVLRTRQAAVLGAIEPQYCDAPAVRLFRDVTDWLKNQCHGLVLLTDDPFQAGRIIRRINAIAAEDASHAEELRERWALPSYPLAFTTVICRGEGRVTSTHLWPEPEDDYPDPEPLVEPEDVARPYPVDALPRLISAAVQEYRAYGQQPLSIIASSALAATSLASQGLADVARDERLVGPISLNFSTVAMSGERKTSVDRHFTKSFREWQTAKRESLAAEAGQARAAIAAWEAEKEGLVGKIKSSSWKKKADNDRADIAAMTIRLSELEQNKPSAVIEPFLFYEDVNAETLAVTFAQGWPSASLWSDEGGLVIGSSGMSDENLMKFVALLNRLWDGHPFERLRLSARSAHLSGRRFTVSLMMQPIIMNRLLGACGGAARNMGFVARNLLAWPASTIGQRPYREPPADTSASNRLNARLRELLDMKLSTEGPQMALVLPGLNLTWQAKKEWVSFFNGTESELCRSGEFGDVADFGSKIAENAARIAGMFHVVEHGPTGEIEKQLMESGIAVVAWHLSEARRVIGVKRRKPEKVADAELLLEWFLRQGDKSIDRRDILRRGPHNLRDKSCRDRALKVLVDLHWLLEMGPEARLILNPKARASP